MSIARFIVCICRHGIDLHTPAGCGYRTPQSACPCPFSHGSVLRTLSEAKQRAVEHEWRREEGGKW